MLARIAHELYWLGRNLARAEFTARAVEAVFQAELQGASETAPGVSFGSGGLLAMLGDVSVAGGATGGRGPAALGQLTLDPERPGSMLASIERARDGARTVRDVISAEMWQAINTTALGLRGDGQPGWAAPAGPFLASQYVKERTALIWGVANRSMLRDEAKCFLDAGGLIEIADMVLRMLQVAMPPADAESSDGTALILLQSVGGFHAYLRAVTAPPNAHPVARFLLFERAYPDSVAACVDSLNEVFTEADAGPRNSKPVLRVSRLAADLDFKRRALPDGAELGSICLETQQELARIDQDVAERYFSGCGARGRAGLRHAMHFSIRYLTEYSYDAPVTDNLNALRVRPATTSTQRCDEFHTRIDPEARVTRHLDYFGTEVIEFGIPGVHDHLTIDVRARVVTSPPSEPPDGPWRTLADPAYVDAAGEFALCWQDQPPISGLGELERAIEADSPLRTLERLCEVIPDRFEYRPGVTYVGSDIEDLLEQGAGVCQDFVHVSLVLLRRRGIAARYVSGYLWAAPDDNDGDSLVLDTHAWLEALVPDGEDDGEPVWVGADPTNRKLADDTHVKIGHGRFYADVPPVKGLYMGGANSELSAAVTLSRLDPQASARA